MRTYLFHVFLIFLVSCYSIQAHAQRRQIEIVQAERMTGDKNLRMLHGNVILKHEHAIMHCDSAYVYATENRFIAYNNIKIIDNTVIITADSLIYSSATNIAKIRGSVELRDNDMVLTTRFLDYNTRERVGYYYQNGKIISSENILTSTQGSYVAAEKNLYFRHNVVLENKDYTIYTDTLKHNTETEISYFFGPTRILSDDNLLYTENGWYNSKNNTAQFFKKSYIQSGANYIYADDLFYNRNTNIGIGRNNVRMIDTTEKISLFGQYGHYNGELKNMFITEDILMIKEFETDSLFLHADSVFYCTRHTKDSTEYYEILAYKHVRFFKEDIQGACDSLVYNSYDTVIVLYRNPILWSDENQITGKEISIHIENSEVSRITISMNAFVVSQDSEVQFNQMKGRSLVGYIANNELYRIDIFNNGETLYYLRDNDELIGVNSAVCDSITVFISGGQAERIIFRSKPQGTLFPPDEIIPESANLQNFRWLDYIRPRNRHDIFEWRE